MKSFIHPSTFRSFGAVVSFLTLFTFTVYLRIDPTSSINCGVNETKITTQQKQDDSLKTTTSIPFNSTKKAKRYSIFPTKLYNIVGLESSGTKFVTNLIKDALQVSVAREGSKPYPYKANDFDEIQVQHFSLPWGGRCEKFNESDIPIVDVILPSSCIRGFKSSAQIDEECSHLIQELWGFDLPKGTPVTYPDRYHLNITTQKEWYEKQGVEFYIIIVIRDESVSREGRYHADHCQNKELLLKEESNGKKIIMEAINTFILERHPTSVDSEEFDIWKASQYQPYLTQTGSDNYDKNVRTLKTSSRTAIPNNNNVILVSYESLMLLKELYVQMLYNALGIESDHVPIVKDGNSKYVMDSFLEKDTPL